MGKVLPIQASPSPILEREFKTLKRARSELDELWKMVRVLEDRYQRQKENLGRLAVAAIAEATINAEDILRLMIDT